VLVIATNSVAMFTRFLEINQVKDEDEPDWFREILKTHNVEEKFRVYMDKLLLDIRKRL
jgi:hypothetical protein